MALQRYSVAAIHALVFLADIGHSIVALFDNFEKGSRDVDVGGLSLQPLSIRSTRAAGFFDRRDATTQPEDPPPTTMNHMRCKSGASAEQGLHFGHLEQTFLAKRAPRTRTFGAAKRRSRRTRPSRPSHGRYRWPRQSPDPDRYGG